MGTKKMVIGSLLLIICLQFFYFISFKIGLPLTFICLHYFGKKNLHTMRGKIDILWHNSSIHCSHLTGWNRC
jgi:hypothetical protein